MSPPSSASDSDSDAPETFTLAEGKKSAKHKTEELEQARAALRRKRRVKNQEKDKVLKEQAEKRKGRERRERDTRSDDVEVRMMRAMREADNEDEGEENLIEVGGAGGEWKGPGSEQDPEEDEDDDEIKELPSDSNESEADEEWQERSQDFASEERSASYLPDHLFEAAFASQKVHQDALQSDRNAVRKSKIATLESNKAKRRRKARAKDLVVGSKTIRTLSNTRAPAMNPGAYAPTRKAQRNRNKALGFKGGNPAVRGWQRKPANIGVLKQAGPAAHFVRS